MAVGFDVDCEYYVNDDGRQMNILATSVWLRYLEISGIEFTFQVNGYKGDYIFDIANSIKSQHGDGFVLDRKSTRLNSSHQIIANAVFC